MFQSSIWRIIKISQGFKTFALSVCPFLSVFFKDNLRTSCFPLHKRIKFWNKTWGKHASNMLIFHACFCLMRTGLFLLPASANMRMTHTSSLLRHPVAQWWNCKKIAFFYALVFSLWSWMKETRIDFMGVFSFIWETQVNRGALCWSECWWLKPLSHVFMRIAKNIEPISPKLWLLCAPVLNITVAKMRLWGRLYLKKWNRAGF